MLCYYSYLTTGCHPNLWAGELLKMPTQLIMYDCCPQHGLPLTCRSSRFCEWHWWSSRLMEHSPDCSCLPMLTGSSVCCPLCYADSCSIQLGFVCFPLWKMRGDWMIKFADLFHAFHCIPFASQSGRDLINYRPLSYGWTIVESETLKQWC